jgi:hypothetical protein
MHLKKEIKVSMKLIYYKADLEANGIAENKIEQLVEDLINCDFKKTCDQPIWLESLCIVEGPNDEWEVEQSMQK